MIPKDFPEWIDLEQGSHVCIQIDGPQIKHVLCDTSHTNNFTTKGLNYFTKQSDTLPPPSLAPTPTLKQGFKDSFMFTNISQIWSQHQ